jgi:hypothetical protein
MGEENGKLNGRLMMEIKITKERIANWSMRMKD